MLGAWVAYPLLLLALTYGAGMLVQLAAGRPLALALRLPCGLALVIAVMDLCTRSTATATLAVPAVVVLAVAGFALAARPLVRNRSWPPAPRSLRPSAGAIAALVVFGLYAAPIVLSGQATWAGYDKLNDTSIWLAIVDQALAHGRTISDLNPSTYSLILANYLTVGYPIGSFLPLGLGSSLLGQDIAWLVDPWMAFNAAMLALALCGAARRVLPRAPAWQSGVIAALAAGSTLLYGYYLWGSIKEVVAATLIAAAAVVAPLPLSGPRRARAALPLLLVAWALVAALSPGGLIWIGPGGLLMLGLIALRPRLSLLSGTRPEGSVATAAGGAEPAGAPAPEPAAAAQATPSSIAAPRGSRTRAAGGGKQRPETRAKSGGKRAPDRARRSARAGDPRRSARRSAVARPPRWSTAAGRLRERAAALGRRARAIPPAWRLSAGAAVLFVVGIVLALRPGGFVETFHVALTGGNQLGALAKPLSPLQIAGIWPTGDFRFAPSDRVATYVLIAVVFLAAAIAFAWSVRRGRWELVAYVLFALAGAGLAVLFGAPWIAAKALASASPALPFAALTAGMLLARRQPVAGALVVVVVGGGILWSDALGYHDVSLAPRALYASLASTNVAVAGQGPTLMTEYSVYGTRHFLRDGDPEDPQDLRSRTDPLANGKIVPRPDYADLDEYDLAYTEEYPTIVLQRSPVATRPAEPYQLTLSNEYWQVWQRPLVVTPPIVSYLPVGDIGTSVEPGEVPACRNVLALSRVPGVTELVAAPAVDPITVSVTSGSAPSKWARKGLLWMHGTGTAHIPVSVAQPGRYAVWLGGSLQNPTSISIDGHLVGTTSDDNEQLGQFIHFGDINLGAGAHLAALHHTSNPLAPGSGVSDVVGPLVLSPDLGTPPLVTVPVSAASTLCGRTLSWIDALGA